MVPSTKENGKTTYNMVRVLRPGLMAPGMKVTMDMAESMALEHTNGMMGLSTAENGMRIRYLDWVFTLG